MGYTLSIGEAAFDKYEYEEVTTLSVIAEPKALDAAPTFPNDEMTGNGNSRSPSYSGWSVFCREAGIYDLFYGNNINASYYETDVEGMRREYPILGDHPGFAAINQHDVDYVKAALDGYKARYPDTTPGFNDWNTKDGDGVSIQDSTMARLIWLHFWMDWAVKNCERPIIQNT